MKIILAIANHKGGCAKTTCSMLMAANLSSDTFKVVVVDLDPQSSASLWAAAGQGKFPAQVIPATAETLPEVLAGLTDADAVLLDCPPSSTAPETLAAIDAADLIVVPCGASPLDYWAADAMIISAELRRPDVSRLVVITQLTHTNLANEMVDAIRKTWPTAQTPLSQRTAYREAAILGLGLRQMPGRKNVEALTELDSLAVEILTTAIRSK